MDLIHFVQVFLLGLLEGLTEFIPVSSTGHLVLGSHFLDFRDPGGAFKIAIQLGAILAVCFAYRQRLTKVTRGLITRDPPSWRFTIAVLLGFLPSVAVGLLVYKKVKELLENPWGVAWALVLGGVAILVIERVVKTPRHHKVEDFSPGLSLRIGLMQCLAMFPGVSRSGATIMGALLMRVDRRAATEYSFFLAIPTMTAATVYDLYKQWSVLSLDDGLSIAIGFVVAFGAALLVVRAVVDFVSKHGFAPFAWYRIILGALAMIGLMLGY